MGEGGWVDGGEEGWAVVFLYRIGWVRKVCGVGGVVEWAGVGWAQVVGEQRGTCGRWMIGVGWVLSECVDS